MTRTDPPPNPLAVGVIIAGIVVALDTILLIAHPGLWPWMLAIYAACALLAAGLVAYEFGAQRDEARGEVERLEREAQALEEELDHVNAVLSEAALREFEVARAAEEARPDLRIVGPQSTGEHDRLALSRAEWDAIVRETEGL